MSLRVLRKSLQYLVLLLIVVYFTAAGFLLVTKYWFLPRIDHWRPNIEASLGKALGVKVELGELKAQWQGLSPRFEFLGLTVFDRKDEEAVVIPHIEAILSWQSLTALEPRFRYIGMEGLALAIQRDTEGKIYVAGFEIDPNENETEQETGATDSQTPWFNKEPVRWILAQRLIDVDDALVYWVDQLHGAPPLKIENLSLTLRNRLLSHRLAGRLTLDLPQKPQVEFAFESARLGTIFDTLGADKIDGELYASATNIDLQRLLPWADLPVVQGNYALRTWLDLTQGKLSHLTLDLAGLGVRAGEQALPTFSLTADSFKLRANTPAAILLSGAQFAEYSKFVGKPTMPTPAALAFSANRLIIDPPADVMSVVELKTLDLQAKVQRDSQDTVTVDLDRLQATTPDGALALAGTWHSLAQSPAGSVDVKGTLSGFDLPKLYHYLPTEVGADVIDWLRLAFKQGEIPQAAFVVRGALDKFPFEHKDEGVFTIDGSVRNWTVDYVPEQEKDALAWPPLVGVEGRFNLNGNLLLANVSGGGLQLPEDRLLNTSRIDVSVSDLFENPVVDLRAQANSEAQNYVKTLQQTALSEVVRGAALDIGGKGQWKMDLSLKLPLDDMEQLRFETGFDLGGGSLTYQDLPAFENVTGQMVINNDGFSTKSLKGQILGGDIALSGNFGQPKSVLNVQGALPVQAWMNHFKMPSLHNWVRGRLAFDASVSAPETKEQPLKFAVQSDLTGLQLLFPAPLNLATGAPLKTRLDWTINPEADSIGQGTLQVGQVLQVRAVGNQAKNKASVFRSMAVGIGVQPQAGDNGLTLKLQSKALDATAWYDVYEQLMKDLNQGKSSVSVAPPLQSAEVNSERVSWNDTHLDQVKATLNVKAEQYALDFAARQTNGKMNWSMHDGKISGRLKAHLSRLELGEKEPDEAKPDKAKKPVEAPKPPDEQTLSLIPPIDLIVDDLVLHGMALGRVELMGENLPTQKAWAIQKLEISNPAAKIDVTGQWRFEQKNPGVDVKAVMNVADLGEMLNRMGQPGQVQRGQGTIVAQIDWKNFPWLMEYDAMSGDVEVDLAQGIFDHVNSESARVLELLSLQSFSRLFDSNISGSDTFSKGFPWSTIRGSLKVDQGKITTDNLKINSPVATISFTGGTNLNTETWDALATIRPNLDMSGTAMATGFLMNPIVGLGALVGQYILKNPIERMLSLRYEVSGPWRDPQLREAGTTTEPIPEPTDATTTDTDAKQKAEGSADTAQQPESVSTDASARGSETGKSNAQQGSSATDNGIEAEKPQEPKLEVYRLEVGKAPQRVEESERRNRPNASSPNASSPDAPSSNAPSSNAPNP